MPELAETPIRSIKIEAKRASDYRRVYIGGGIGGLTPQGIVHLDLYYDIRRLPTEFERVVDEEGTAGPETSLKSSEIVLDRDIVLGLLMTARTAEELGKWLIKRAREWDELQADVIEAGIEGAEETPSTDDE